MEWSALAFASFYFKGAGGDRLSYRYLISLDFVGVAGIFLSLLTTPKSGRNGGKTLNK